MGDNNTKKKNTKTLTVVMIVLLTVALLGGLAGSYLVVDEIRGGAPTPAPVTPSPEPTAAPTPEPEEVHAGYFACPDGLFYPEEPLTREDLARALSLARGREITFPGDGEEALTVLSFAECLSTVFPDEAAVAAAGDIARRGGESVTRAEAASALNLLLGIEPGTGESVFPDVEPWYWACEDIAAAAETGSLWPGDEKLPQPGYTWVDGYLYYAGEDGYFIKNAYLGTLYFGPGGRYTSGSLELDGYVAAAIRENTDESMSREEKLRAMYLYVRDNFEYLRRHYYRIGDLGWQVEEAITMYSTGKGNCYCYSSAFWAAARGLGYDAKAVSGTYGEEHAPHGWVEIMVDGQRLTYDVEIEMTIVRDNKSNRSLYAMDENARRPHGYVELIGSDNLAPRETNVGLLPR